MPAAAAAAPAAEAAGAAAGRDGNGEEVGASLTPASVCLATV